MIRVLSVMGLYLSHALPVDIFRPYARSPKGHPYIAYYFTSQIAQTQLKMSQRGIKNSLGLEDIRAVKISIPPLAEQQRIVAKVEQLMALCDELEAKLKEVQGASGQLLGAAVNHLLVRSNSEKVTGQWPCRPGSAKRLTNWMAPDFEVPLGDFKEYME